MDENQNKNPNQQKRGFVDYLNSGYNRANQLRTARSLGKTVGKKLVKQAGKKAAEEGVVMAGEAVGAPLIAVIGGIVAVVVFVLIIVTIVTPGTTLGGNTPNPSGENTVPGPSGSPGATPGTPPSCKSGNMAACLKTDFNITVTNANSSQMADVYNIFSLPFSYPTYKNLIGSSPLNIVFLTDSKGCHGWTPNGSTLDIYNFSYCQSLPFRNRQYLLIHESGHVISFRTRLSQSYVSSAWNKDSSCYDQGYLKTYPLRCGSSCGISPQQESFAESIADYVMCSGGGTCQYSGAGNGYSQPIYNFPSACPTTDSWVGANVF